MTKMVSALIVDDEALARRLSKEYLRQHHDIEIIGECDNGFDAVQAISDLQPDIILLDIQMPKLSGLEVLELTKRSHGVIFTTAFDQFALKAFDLHAVDYLLKPFSQARFNEAIFKARTTLGKNLANVDNLLAQVNEKLSRILVRDRGQIFIIPTEKIDYIEAQDDYIQIYTEGRSIMKTQSLSNIESQLDASHFVRIHRSYLLRVGALKCLERINKDSQMAVLHSGAQLPISRSGSERLKAFL